MWLDYGCLQPVPILCQFLDVSEYMSLLLHFQKGEGSITSICNVELYYYDYSCK